MKTKPNPFLSLLSNRLAFVVMSATALFCSHSATAFTYDWSGATSGNMSGTTANWGGTTPTATDIARWNSATYTNAPTANSNMVIGELLFDAGNTGGVTFGSGTGTLTLNGISGVGIQLNSGSGAVSTGSAKFSLGGDQTWLNNSENTFTVGGTITNASSSIARTLTLDGTGSTLLNGIISNNSVGTTTLTKQGSGTLTLGGANSFTGGLNIQQGTVKLGATAGAGAGLVTIGSSGNSGVLDLNGASRTINSLATAGTAAAQKITNSAAGPATVNYTGATTSTFGGVIENGTGGSTTALTVNNAGANLTLSGANTYTGLTTVTNGTLKISATNAINSGNALTTAAAGIFDLNGFDQTLGTLINGGNVTNSGVTTKTLTFGSASASSGAGSYTGAMNVILNNGAVTTTLSGSWSNTGSITLNAGSAAINLTTGTVNNGGTITNSGSNTGATTISASIGSNVGLITQNSAGSSLTLSGTNINAGGVTLTTGTLKLGSTTALGATASTLSIGAGTTLDSTVANLVLANNNAQNWNGSFTFTGTNSLDLGTGALTLAAPLTVTTTANTLTVGGTISGGTIFDVTKAGAGTLVYGGNTAMASNQTANITAGTLALTGNVTGGYGITVNGPGTLSLRGATGNAAASAITVNAGSALTFDSSTVGVTGTTRAASVTLKGASLNIAGNSSANSVDIITGALTVNAQSAVGGTGVNTVTLTSDPATNTRLAANSLVRADNGVVFFRGTNLGANTIASNTAGTSNIVFTVTPQLVGGGGLAGSQNISILPWAVGATSASGAPSSFVTYDAKGIRPLDSGEYVTTVSATVSTNNVKLSGASPVTADGVATINSLFLNNAGSSATVLAGTGALTVTSGAIYADFSLGGNSNALTISKPVDFGTAEGVIGTMATANSKTLAFSGGISGSGGITIYDANGVTSTTQAGVNFNGTNTYTGNTIINGTLIASGTNALPNFANNSRTGDVYVNGTLGLSGSNNSTVRINGLYGNGRIVTPFSNNETIIVGDNNATSTFGGTIVQTTGAIGLTKVGTGTLTLTGTSSSWTAATNVQNGTLSVITLNNIASPNATSSLGKPVTAATGTIGLGSLTTIGQLTVVGSGETTDRVISLAGRTGGGTIDQSGTGLLKFTSDFTAPGVAGTDQRKTLTLQGSTAGTGEISGAIVDSVLGTAGQLATSVAKTGTGTWNLTGTNTYTGNTTVTAGKLTISSTGSIAAGSAVSVTGGELNVNGTVGGTVSVSSSAKLSGTGTIGGTTTISGIHAPGNGTGTQAFSGDLTYAGSSIFEWELAADKDTDSAGVRGADYAAVNVAGNLAAGSGAIFRVVLAGADVNHAFWDADQSWTDIFSKAFNVGGFSTTTLQVYQGGSVYNTSAQGTFTIDGGTLNWTAVPEPSGVLVGGLLLCVTLRRRRA